jgi:hypothetical protein
MVRVEARNRESKVFVLYFGLPIVGWGKKVECRADPILNIGREIPDKSLA